MKHIAAAACLAVMAFVPARAEIAVADARAAFEDLHEVCREKAPVAFGQPLCGYTMFVEPSTRHYVFADVTGRAPTLAGIEEGILPPKYPVANTSLEWQGHDMAMIMWPLPEQKSMRQALMLHEHYHRIQPKLSFSSGSMTEAGHLDAADMRLWLRLELRALKAAVEAGTVAGKRRHALAAALFHKKRTAENDPAREAERYLMVHEGMAEYTGRSVAETGNESLISFLTHMEKSDSFSRSYAYAAGAAWGQILDELVPDWKEAFDGRQNLPEIYLGHEKTESASAEALAEPYDYEAVRGEEAARADRMAGELADYKTRFVTGLVLVLPSSGFSMDPNTAVSLGGDGTVYRTLTFSGPWGTLVTKRGGLLAPDYSYGVVDLVGVGGDVRHDNISWTLTLAEGWELVPHPRGMSIGRTAASQAPGDQVPDKPSSGDAVPDMPDAPGT